MGVTRLLAKGWVVFCLFAAAHAVNLGLARGETPEDALAAVGICVALFGAMGLLFIAGFGASSGGGTPLLARIRKYHVLPGFNETVFLAFVVASFVVQVFVAPGTIGAPQAEAVAHAVAAVVPGQDALTDELAGCALDGGRIFASAFTWLLAMIYLASAMSRIGLTAGLLRLERMRNPSAFGPTLLASIYGVVALIGFQLLYIGSAYPWIGCTTYTDITGSLLIGLAPLMLAYMIVAALVTLKASGPEARPE